MWINEYEISEQMYYKCREDDKQEYREHITGSFWSFCYCRFVKDRPEIRKQITKLNNLKMYNKYVTKGDKNKYVIKG